MGSAIGSKVWYRGDEVTITTEPYNYCGGEFQDAVTADGRTVSIATEVHRAKRVAEERAAYQRMQDGFSGLKKSR